MEVIIKIRMEINEIEQKKQQSQKLVFLEKINNLSFNKSTNSKCRQGHREKGTLVHFWWECRYMWNLQNKINKQN